MPNALMAEYYAQRATVGLMIAEGTVISKQARGWLNSPGIYPSGKQPYETPRALETNEVSLVVEDYRQAAVRAKDAGFDGVEIHAANGYLIDQFLQSKSNQRTDQYGGSLENRYRFLKEIVEALLTVWPANRVGVRLSPNGNYNDMGSEDFRETFLYVASQLNAYGLAYLHIAQRFLSR